MSKLLLRPFIAGVFVYPVVAFPVSTIKDSLVGFDGPDANAEKALESKFDAES